MAGQCEPIAVPGKATLPLPGCLPGGQESGTCTHSTVRSLRVWGTHWNLAMMNIRMAPNSGQGRCASVPTLQGGFLLEVLKRRKEAVVTYLYLFHQGGARPLLL